MVVIGLDPGSVSFGIGIIKSERGQALYLHSERIQLKGKDFFSRMSILWEKLGDILDRFPVEAAAMEEAFLGKNIHSLAQLNTVRGLALAALVSRRIPLASYSPREVKMALTGYGNASKQQINRMAIRLLNIRDRAPTWDESDALAVACCHALRNR